MGLVATAGAIGGAISTSAAVGTISALASLAAVSTGFAGTLLTTIGVHGAAAFFTGLGVIGGAAVATGGLIIAVAIAIAVVSAIGYIAYKCYKSRDKTPLAFVDQVEDKPLAKKAVCTLSAVPAHETNLQSLITYLRNYYQHSLKEQEVIKKQGAFGDFGFQMPDPIRLKQLREVEKLAITGNVAGCTLLEKNLRAEYQSIQALEAFRDSAPSLSKATSSTKKYIDSVKQANFTYASALHRTCMESGLMKLDPYLVEQLSQLEATTKALTNLSAGTKAEVRNRISRYEASAGRDNEGWKSFVKVFLIAVIAVAGVAVVAVSGGTALGLLAIVAGVAVAASSVVTGVHHYNQDERRAQSFVFKNSRALVDETPNVRAFPSL